MLLITKLRQPKVLLMKWGLRGPRVLLLFATFCIVVIVIRTFIRGHFPIYLFKDADAEAANGHGKLYCNKPGNVVGKEGHLSFFKGGKRNYQLQQVYIVIRHGDRAPIMLNTFPNSRPVEVPCKFNKSWTFYDDLVQIKKGAFNFRVSGHKTHPILQERDTCLGGQLTPIGFAQHLNNGKFLKRQYSDFLGSINDPSMILSMSTAYSRTVQSAASLLFGIFGDRFKDRKMEIQVQDDKYRETHFLKDGQGDNIYCPALAQKLKDIWKVDELHDLRIKIDPIRKKYAEIFDSHRGEIPALDRIVDILYVTMCHGQLFPKAPKGDISYKLAKTSFELADHLISLKHQQTAELQTLAILSQIVHKTAKRIKSLSEKDSNWHKLVIFSAHDTVIAPLLQMLGAHNWKWPPYASRVVFEVWKDSDNKPEEAKDLDQFLVFRSYFIRVLYNGNDVTSMVKFCSGQVIENQFCPFSAFVKYVADGQFEGDNYFERITNLCVGTDL
ncbi:2-phosphoxylose phosphatase 1-like [Rhopilema esculentum]|uniref:2-phosphoxylose phosphatase 1-like n=1 Tax=Rhopilema esculentum TaxID=499914 RepID=UPI0031E03803|eukprot:gene6824-12417_t